MAVKEKKVELIELFYDLIYVYAISRMTLLIEEPEGGVITWEMYAHYIIASMVIIQAWLFMTNYVNRYCKWRWYEYVLFVANMSAAMLMSQTIYNDPGESALALISSMVGMFSCIGALYFIQYRTGDGDVTYAKNSLNMFALILTIYLIALCLNLLGFKEESMFILTTNIVLGMLLPFTKKRKFDLVVTYFPHLVERLELLTIVTFGEAITCITVFFDLLNPDPLALMSFMVIILMFGSYVCQIHYLCNHHQEVKAQKMIWSHYIIIISINLITVAFLYSENEEADQLFTAVLMSVCLLVFHIALFSTSGYCHSRFVISKKDVLAMLLSVLIGSIIIVGFYDERYALMIGSLIGFGLNFAYLLSKFISARKRENSEGTES